MEISYALPDNLGSVIFSNNVLAQFIKYQQKSLLSREAGGQLFCSFGEGILRVEIATGPTQRGLRSRFGFKPNRKEEQKEIDAIFSEEDLHFIGDWHTHPQDIPAPSGPDIESIESILRKGKHELPGVLLVVVGRMDFPEGLYVSFHTPSGQHVLEPIAI